MSAFLSGNCVLGILESHVAPAAAARDRHFPLVEIGPFGARHHLQWRRARRDVFRIGGLVILAVLVFVLDPRFDRLGAGLCVRQVEAGRHVPLPDRTCGGSRAITVRACSGRGQLGQRWRRTCSSVADSFHHSHLQSQQKLARNANRTRIITREYSSDLVREKAVHVARADLRDVRPQAAVLPRASVADENAQVHCAPRRAGQLGVAVGALVVLREPCQLFQNPAQGRRQRQ